MLPVMAVGLLGAASLAAQTDTLLAADGASRLVVETLRGEVVVRTWERDEVRILADQPPSRSLSIERSGRTLTVEEEVERGLGIAGSLDLEITVPRAFDLDLEGMALGADVEGVEGEVEVSTVQGSIRVVGGRGSVTLETVSGEILLEGASGRIEVSGVSGSVTLRDCSGTVRAESVAGALTLEGIRADDVEAETVSGTVRYTGEVQPGGAYNFSSHAGSVWLFLPEGMSASVDAATLVGDIVVDYPGAPSAPTRVGDLPGLPGKELRFEVGDGSARVEVETYAGQIHLLRQGGDR